MNITSVESVYDDENKYVTLLKITFAHLDDDNNQLVVYLSVCSFDVEYDTEKWSHDVVDEYLKDSLQAIHDCFTDLFTY